MATEGSNLHDDGGGRTDNRPAYSCHSRQKAGSILEEEDGAAAQQTAPILPPPPLPAAFLRLPAWSSPWQLTAAAALRCI